jgi:activating signal cointegrator complex subunit 3
MSKQRPRLTSALRLSYCPHTKIRVDEEKQKRKSSVEHSMSTLFSTSSSTSLSWSTFSSGIDRTLPSTKRNKKAFQHYVAETIRSITGGMSTSEMDDATGMLFALMLEHEAPPKALTPIFGIVDNETWRNGRMQAMALRSWRLSVVKDEEIESKQFNQRQEYSCNLDITVKIQSWEHLLSLPAPIMLPASEVAEPSATKTTSNSNSNSNNISSIDNNSNNSHMSFNSSTNNVIDAQWLLERCEQHIVATNGIFSPKELGNNILAAIKAGKKDEGKLQADLFNLLGESGFDFLLLLFEKKSDLCLIKNVDQPSTKHKKRQTKFVRPESSSVIGGVGVQVASTVDKETHKALKRERRRLKRQGLTEEEIDAELFGGEKKHSTLAPTETKSNLNENGLRPETSNTARFQRSLPKGTKRIVHDQWEEVIVPAPNEPPPSQLTPLVPTTDLPDWAQLAFRGMKSLNRLQSQVYNSAFNTSENLLICAPTGAGKTNVAMLSVLQCLSNHMEDGVIMADQFKMIYVCPMKALASEITDKFGRRLRPLGLNVKELTGDTQLSKNEIDKTHMLVVTPEKWDVITRKAGGDGTLISKVKLLIIDEVHLLADDRGAVIETLVARTLRQIETTQKRVRIVGLSATLPNYKDVAIFLRVNSKGLFYFDRSWRPVPLEMTFAGVTVGKNSMKQKLKLNEIAYEKCAHALARNRQVLVFVHSRKETVKSAQAISELARKNGTSELFSPSQDDASNYKLKLRDVSKSKNKDVRELYTIGMGCHHAGMLRKDRHLTESLFKEGLIRVLVCTATLAWGVNLPAATVVIKGTQIYDPEKSGMREIGVLDVQQIFGRAGRPQYDKAGEGIIITQQATVSRYLAMLTHQIPIESQYIKSLSDNLNAEVTAGTVTNVKEAVVWLSYTYLYVRMRKNPMVYGVSYEELSADHTLLKKRTELIESAARHLDDCRMLRYDMKSGNLAITDLGRVASHFYLLSDTIAHFNENLKDYMTMPEVFDLVCNSSELNQVRVRDDELKELDQLKKQSPIQPVKGGIENSNGKCNVLLQAFISNVYPRSFTLVSDMMYVSQNAGRISRGLFEICLRKGNSTLAEQLLRLTKSIDKRTWWSPITHPLRQFTPKLLALEIVRKLEDSKMGSLDSLCNGSMTSKDVSQLLRLPKSGDKILSLVSSIPYLDVQYSVQPITRTVLRIKLNILSAFTWNDRIHGKTSSEPFWIWILDSECETIYYSEYFLMDKKMAMSDASIPLTFTVPIYEPMPSQYFVRIVSDRWIGSSQTLPISFQHLTLPKKQSPPTDLLNLNPLPVTSLNNIKYQNLYSFTHFNPIQTQVFHALYHGVENILLCSPTGSGKTICCELAVLALLRDYPNSKVAYLAPMKALTRERLKDWTTKFKPLGLNVSMLTGDVTPNMKTLENSHIIVTTPEKWDGVTRQWRKRNYVQQVKLLIIDEIHLLGEERGPVLESVVSRVRYISEQIKRDSQMKKIANQNSSRYNDNIPCRIVGLSTALSNADDLASWLGCSSSKTVFNFRPSVRPVPIEVHIAGFPGKHYCPRMQTMNKPTYAAIERYSPFKPTLVFVSSRRQTRLTAFELINYCTQDDNPYRFLKISQDNMLNISETVKDKSLRRTLSFGIGIHHGGLSLGDRKIAEELFLNGSIQILVCTATLAWGVNLPAHLVVLKGTEFFDGKTMRYEDYAITDVLQMMGRAGRPQFDDKGVACVLVHEPKKNFYRKFLYEPFPVESQLLKMDKILYDQLNAEIAGGSVQNKSDAINFLTWTFMWRRLVQNPSFYGLEDTTDDGVANFLLGLVEKSFNSLHQSKCVVVDGENIASTKLGEITSNYYISYQTGYLFHTRVSSFTKDTTTLEDCVRLLSDSTEFDEVPVRHNEEELNGELAKFCPWKVDSLAMGDPHVKTFLLLQARRMGIRLPIQDFVSDTTSVLQQMPRLTQALLSVIRELKVDVDSKILSELNKMYKK